MFENKKINIEVFIDKWKYDSRRLKTSGMMFQDQHLIRY